MWGILTLLGFAIVIGSIAGLVSIFKWEKIHLRLARLERELDRLRVANIDPLASQSSRESSQESPQESPQKSEIKGPVATAWSSDAVFDDETRSDGIVQDNLASTKSPSASEIKPSEDNAKFNLWVRIQENWMIWLGGACVALAGIFLAKYSIELGILGPIARVSMGLFTGIALFVAAEWLRFRTGKSHPAFAALAGGGSITLFAALLAALHLYDMFSPTTTFILLSIVALATMCMAYLHGPTLAGIGILGAYIVPMLVSSGSGKLLFVLAYSLVISTSAMLLMRYIYRSWLWFGLLLGAIGWWGLSLSYADTEGYRGWYLTVLAYLMLAIPRLDWTLSQPLKLLDDNYKALLVNHWLSGSGIEKLIPMSIFALVIAQGVSIIVEGPQSIAIMLWSPMVILLLVAARHRENLTLMPWFLLIWEIFSLILRRLTFHNERVDLSQITDLEERGLLWFLAVTALIYSVFSLRNFVHCKFKAIWSSLAVLAPLMMLITGYFLTARSLVSWQWSTLAIAMGLIYLGIVSAVIRNGKVESLVVWLIFGGHFAIALAASMVLAEASLTLVFAVQIISISVIIKQFQLEEMSWLLKLLVVTVLLRLTLNPWLAGYPDDVHWSLWTYGGSTLCCVIASRVLVTYPLLGKWAEAAALHLFVLTLWAEVRYWLYDGVIFLNEYSLMEAGLNTALLGSIAIVYFIRGETSQHLKKLYRTFSKILIILALLNYLIILLKTFVSSAWVWAAIGDTAIFNLLLLVYAIPVLLSLLAYQFYMPEYKKIALICCGIFSFIFISLEIRHLWQGSIRLDGIATGDSELYTYSAVWLLMAVGAVLGGTWRFGHDLYRAGMILLGLVIVKLFLIDMSDLEGLLRVASFMGLGLCLLATSYLHQKLQVPER